MAAIVLVHGAWQGAWCWERVTPLLEQAGHRVESPTLRGSGDRASELSPEVTLDDHIDEVSEIVASLNEGGVLLVGHSYAGMVLAGVAERIADRLAGLVFIDAFYPRDGESALDQMPEQFQAMFRRRAAEDGDGWRLPAGEGLLDVWGLHEPELRQWVGSRLTDWSIRCFETPARIPDRTLGLLPRTYVAATAEGYPARAAFGVLATRAADDGCRLVEIPTGHDVMLEAPGELSEAIIASAGPFGVP
ncbi:alpha/beta fold hydrolase [soil metagenome]